VPSRSALLAALALLVAGCGGAAHKAPPSTTSTSAPTPKAAPAPKVATTTTGPGALQAEATAAAAGDIPDNQVFLSFRNPTAGYAMKYPEGWAQQGSGTSVVFRDKNNIVRIVIGRGGATSPAAVVREVRSLSGATLHGRPTALDLPGGAAVKAVYTTRSAPNPVTGKRVTLTVDRYYVWHGNRRAIVDLGTPVGVDNVDAYRLMIESFRWR
jgi:hypothetical protein